MSVLPFVFVLYLIDLLRARRLESRLRRNKVPRIGLTEILVIALILLLLFGATRIPEMMRGLARGLRGFKEELKAEEKPKEQGEEKPKPS